MTGFIVVLGMVGAGKSVQSKELARRHGWIWLSTGELLRASSNPVILSALQTGHLLDDNIILPLIESTLLSSPAGIVIIDGFPRRVSQARWLENYGKQHTMPILKVIHLNVEPKIAIRRLAERGRSDDTPAGIAARNAEYDQEAKPVIELFRHRGLLVEINANSSMAEVAERIDLVLAEANLI